MRFGIFYEHQIPRPWGDDGEQRLMQDALEQIELADRVGLDSVWEVEHHFLEEYSHSSASGVFLGAASQRTKRIRLGFGILPLPLASPAPPPPPPPPPPRRGGGGPPGCAGPRLRRARGARHGRDLERRRARG